MASGTLVELEADFNSGRLRPWPLQPVPSQHRPPRRSAPAARAPGAALVAAARRVFERDGFLEARITDITAEAGVASGSFYTYFTPKEDAFAAVMEELNEEMLHPRLREVVRPRRPRSR